VTPGAELGDSYSIVRLDGTTLRRLDKWTVPGLFGTDQDFGSSPTLFVGSVGGVATKLIGACNKNGKFYAWKRFALSDGPVWSLQVAAEGPPTLSCITSAIWDSAGRRLFVAASSTTINGTPFRGSIRRLNPDTGVPIWERGLPCPVLGSPSMNGSGVIAVGTYGLCTTDLYAIHLINAANGNIVGTLPTDSRTFGQPVFADDLLLVATETAGLAAYRVTP
jgi:hypothetical protein